MTINKPSSGCNTAKCSSCNMKLVCAHSPFLLLESDTSDNSNIIKAIAEMQGFLVNYVEHENGVIQGLSQSIISIKSDLETLSQILAELSDNIEKYYHDKDSYNYNESEEESNDYTNTSSNEIAPYDSNQKVLVEKRGFFGRKKWVEEDKQ